MFGRTPTNILQEQKEDKKKKSRKDKKDKDKEKEKEEEDMKKGRENEKELTEATVQIIDFNSQLVMEGCFHFFLRVCLQLVSNLTIRTGE